MAKVRRMFKFALNGSGVKSELIFDETSKQMVCAVVTVHMSAWDRVRSVQCIGPRLNLYAQVEEENGKRDDMMDRYFYICPTGGNIPEKAHNYIGTCTQDNGLVWHILEGDKS